MLAGVWNSLFFLIMLVLSKFPCKFFVNCPHLYVLITSNCEKKNPCKTMATQEPDSRTREKIKFFFVWSPICYKKKFRGKKKGLAMCVYSDSFALWAVWLGWLVAGCLIFFPPRSTFLSLFILSSTAIAPSALYLHVFLFLLLLIILLYYYNININLTSDVLNHIFRLPME